MIRAALTAVLDSLGLGDPLRRLRDRWALSELARALMYVPPRGLWEHLRAAIIRHERDRLRARGGLPLHWTNLL